MGGSRGKNLENRPKSAFYVQVDTTPKMLKSIVTSKGCIGRNRRQPDTSGPVTQDETSNDLMGHVSAQLSVKQACVAIAGRLCALAAGHIHK
jgi:hypothetical protein